MTQKTPQFELNRCLSRSGCGQLVALVVKGSDDVGDVDGDWIGVGNFVGEQGFILLLPEFVIFFTLSTLFTFFQRNQLNQLPLLF